MEVWEKEQRGSQHKLGYDVFKSTFLKKVELLTN